MVIEYYKTEVKKVGNSLTIIIPSNIVKYNGIKKGDRIKFYFTKIRK